jgi:hypothetical protein
MGANLDEFEGQVNNKETASTIQNSILNSLTFDNFLSPSDITVEITPISESSIFIRLNLSTILTNQLNNSKITVDFIYDLQGKGPFLVK